MSLAPPWAKPAAILGLEMQLEQLAESATVQHYLIEQWRAELERIRAMKA